MTMSIRLLCLDLGGTIVDDHDAAGRALRRAIIDCGIPDGTDRMERAMSIATATLGQSRAAVFHEIFRNPQQADFAYARFDSTFRAIVSAGGLLPIPGVDTLLEELRAAGISVCVMTGLSPDLRDVVLEELGWTNKVDLALSAEDVGRGRPWPDLILSAALRREIDDVRAVAVAGDTVSDLVAGYRAGASHLIGVTGGAHGRDELLLAPHTHLVERVTEIGPILLTSRRLDSLGRRADR